MDEENGASHKPFLFPCWTYYEVTTGTLGQTHIWFWYLCFGLPWLASRKLSPFSRSLVAPLYTRSSLPCISHSVQRILAWITFHRTHILIHTSFMCTFSLLYPHNRKVHTLPKSSHKSEGVWSTTPGRGSRRGWVIYWLLIFQVVLTWHWSLPSLNDNICLPAGKTGNINKRYI